MKYFFLIMTLLLTLACTRTTPSGQTADSITPPSEKEKITSKRMDKTIFKGSGNEPFWSLQIDKNRTISFKSIDDHQLDIKATITEITRVNDANALNMTAETADEKITIVLMEDRCLDNMSEKGSSHGLQIVIKNGTSKNTVLYKGCGEFLNDYLINNHWELERIGDKNITEFSLDKVPTLKINLLENKMNGFTGCNTVFGDLRMDNELIEFGNVGMTKKACRDNTVESAIVKLLNYKKIKHSLTEDGKLILSDLEQTFIYKPIK